MTDPIDAIFRRLLLTYGKRFTDAYVGQSVDEVRAHWASELRGMSLDAMRHAIGCLPPDHPPNVLQFRALCAQYRPAMRSAIPMDRKHVPMPSAVKAKLDALRGGFNGDPLAWARSLQRKEQNGVHLTRVQKEAWRIALRRETSDEHSE